ncbi:hypothetical protein NIASO_12690 [Niabella soli DSM 19437]|uniref:Uncharacterized protein n=1 Tax=Niabella soli DSM 19437 TaxID=929713 RepID=W0F8D2_9BACT|nr:hypothetical protein NIASO_12690 [Niabella soli DSM 19437]
MINYGAFLFGKPYICKNFKLWEEAIKNQQKENALKDHLVKAARPIQKKQLLQRKKQKRNVMGSRPYDPYPYGVRGGVHSPFNDCPAACLRQALRS